MSNVGFPVSQIATQLIRLPLLRQETQAEAKKELLILSLLQCTFIEFKAWTPVHSNYNIYFNYSGKGHIHHLGFVYIIGCDRGKCMLKVYFHGVTSLRIFAIYTKQIQNYTSQWSSSYIKSTNIFQEILQSLNILRALYVQFRTVNTLLHTLGHNKASDYTVHSIAYTVKTENYVRGSAQQGQKTAREGSIVERLNVKWGDQRSSDLSLIVILLICNFKILGLQSIWWWQTH